MIEFINTTEMSVIGLNSQPFAKNTKQHKKMQNNAMQLD